MGCQIGNVSCHLGQFSFSLGEYFGGKICSSQQGELSGGNDEFLLPRRKRVPKCE